MCLARNAIPISQDGTVYDSGNIDALLLQCHTARKTRMSGGRLKGNPKRTPEQTKAFEEKLSMHPRLKNSDNPHYPFWTGLL